MRRQAHVTPKTLTLIVAVAAIAAGSAACSTPTASTAAPPACPQADLVAALQQGTFPDDSRSAAHRFGALINNAPPEIKEAIDHLVGPVIETLQHPDAQGSVTSDAVTANVKTIEQWHATHC